MTDDHWAGSPRFYAAMTVVVVLHVGYLVWSGADDLLVAASLGLAGYLVYRTVRTAGEDGDADAA